MRKIFAWAAMAAMIALGWSSDGALAATQKKTPAKKSTARNSTAKSTARKATSTASSKKSTSVRKGTTSASARGRKGPVKKAVTWRNRQTTPSSDRYREIQSALAARGYLSPDEATGTWNQASIDALKKFQAEQNIDSSGKINSLSLIALGLGPRRDAVAAVPKPPQTPAQLPGPGQ